MVMKKVVLIAMTIFVCILFIACNDVKLDKKTHVLQEQERKLVCIKLSSLPETNEYTFSGEAANEIYEYLANLKTEYYSSNNDLNGITYVISIEYDNGDLKTLYHFSYLIGTDDGWYKIKNYEEQEFENLIKKLADRQGD